MKQNKKRGITLVELICTLAIFAITAGLVAGVFSTAVGLYNDVILVNKAKADVQSLQTLLEADLRYASAVTITSAPQAGALSVHSAAGRICRDAAAVYLETAAGIWYDVSFALAQNGAVTANFSAKKEAGTETEKVIYTSSVTLAPLNVSVTAQEGATRVLVIRP